MHRTNHQQKKSESTSTIFHSSCLLVMNSQQERQKRQRTEEYYPIKQLTLKEWLQPTSTSFEEWLQYHLQHSNNLLIRRTLNLYPPRDPWAPAVLATKPLAPPRVFTLYQVTKAQIPVNGLVELTYHELARIQYPVGRRITGDHFTVTVASQPHNNNVVLKCSRLIRGEFCMADHGQSQFVMGLEFVTTICPWLRRFHASLASRFGPPSTTCWVF